MSLKFKKSIKLFFNIKILVTLIIGISAIVIGNTILKNIDIVISLIHTIINTISNFLKFKIPIWSIVLSLLVIFLIIILFSNIKSKSFLRYKEDEIESIFWRWNYISSSNKKYSINDLKHHCPICKCELSLNQHEYYYCANPGCDNNKSTMMYKKEKDDIIKIIKKRIREKFPNIIDKFN